jgi:hypothetical protein
LAANIGDCAAHAVDRHTKMRPWGRRSAAAWRVWGLTSVVFAAVLGAVVWGGGQ